ncbi:hypothetical protein H6F86_18705 [Phormidium sp. FACHB-592]|uniref:Uncharacterized protein n=1 Tax=Stenomitos frigidus AS-A4 TaxID=2933935 RepID=A0ABV0KR36_9CYAN|nr:hypothetical protein [Phormidium sp. FACHB-592]MBD2075885.1 hypothetical protein [Phormidium sp. FACHB-592]
MKPHKLYRLALLTVGSVLVAHTILASPARAGGGDAPDAVATAEYANCSTESADSNGNQPNPEANRKCKQKPRILDWRDWSQPQVQGNNLCREHLNGNTVCLTAQSAAKLRW